MIVPRNRDGRWEGFFMPHVVQPAKLHLVARQLTTVHVARILGISQKVLGDVLNGRVPSTPRIRAGLATLLNVPEDQLFREDNARRRHRPLTNGAAIEEMRQRVRQIVDMNGIGRDG
jgi:transcriptional regulator with XRE-family HTH domain